MCRIFLFSYKPWKKCEMSINIMNNRRILQLPSLQTYIVFMHYPVYPTIDWTKLLSFFWETWNIVLQHINNKGIDKEI